MIIVVSKNKFLEDKGFLVVDTLEDAEKVVGRIEALVYHKSNETSEDKILYLSRLKSRVSTFIYICNDKDTDVMVKMAIIGFNGKYFDDEFFIESGNELHNLVNSLDEVTEVAELGGVSVLSDFLNRYLKNGSSDFSPKYLVVVKEAVQCLMKEYSQKNYEILQMSETATELFSNTAEVLSLMKQEHGEMKKAVVKLEQEIKKGTGLISGGVGDTNKRLPSLVFFPQVSYMKERKIIRVKEIGNFRHLVSFFLGFRIYLETMKNVRPKLVIIEPVGELLEKEFSEYTWITSKKLKDKKLFYNNVVFTNCPNKEVLSTLLDDTNFDTFVIVDRTKNGKEHVLNSKGSLFYAVSGKSNVSRFSLPIGMCISSVTDLKGGLFTVEEFEDYPEERSARERLYLSKCTKNYSMLY